MALFPLNRPAESTQVLRYRGAITVGEATAVYPKTDATFPSDSTIDAGTTFFTAWVRFALFDPSDLTDTQTLLPLNVYDDNQPADDAPHAAVACAVSATLGINATDLSLNTRTWAQNLQIRYTQIDENVLLADAAVSVDNDPANGAMVLLDNATTSGLGDGQGLPVVAVKFVVATTQGGARQDFNVDITFEVRHSNHR